MLIEMGAVALTFAFVLAILLVVAGVFVRICRE